MIDPCCPCAHSTLEFHKVDEKRTPDSANAKEVYHDMSRGDGGAGTRAILKSIGSDPISPLVEQALTYSTGPAMASTTDAPAAFVRWDLFRNSMLRFMEDCDAVLSPVAPFPALAHGTARAAAIRRCTI